jgi:hypothetical protein
MEAVRRSERSAKVKTAGVDGSKTHTHTISACHNEDNREKDEEKCNHTAASATMCIVMERSRYIPICKREVRMTSQWVFEARFV